MNGKKAAILLVGFILLVALAVAIAMQFFFATYEPKSLEVLTSLITENR